MKVGLFLSSFPQLEAVWNDMTPLGLAYLASYARQQVDGIEVLIERDFQALLDAKPDLVGISTVTQNSLSAIQHALQVKEALGCPVIIGGPHVSLVPSILDDPFDVAVLGEGEETSAELLRLFHDEKKLSPKSLSKIQGIRYRDDSGAIVQTEPRQLIADLDTLPFPDRQSTWRKWPRQPREASLTTSRGCPCRDSGRTYRYASVDYVMRELDEVMTLHEPRLIHFYDELFVERKDRALQIMEQIRERGYHKSVQFTCLVQSSLLDDELMDAFARSGFTSLSLCDEESDDQKKNIAAAELARKHGVRMMCTFMLGAPGETREHVLKTFELVSNYIDVFDSVHFRPLEIMPATQIWEMALQKGYTQEELLSTLVDPENIGANYERSVRHMPYLNEDLMSRDELFSYLEVARTIQSMVMKQAELRRKRKQLELQVSELETALKGLGSPSHIAETTPLLDIAKAKVRRRVGNLLTHAKG